jgi:extracellular factor (EF) 3-hydroxypalmitic acid methyl ester biosynthesis protein
MEKTFCTAITTHGQRNFFPGSQKLQRHLQLIDALFEQGGPKESEYDSYSAWLVEIGELAESGKLSPNDITALLIRFGEACSVATLQGFSTLKPHGYACDYEIIDKMYRRHVAPERHLANWDRYFQSLPAANAVRNRKTYFHELLDRRMARRTGTVNVLNVASGPGRDIYEYFSLREGAEILFHCVEQDAGAISYASALCSDYAANVLFTRGSAVRFKPERRYNLVWSAGLFDYFEDRLFIVVLKNLLAGVLPGGELVIGNFSTGNPSRHYMRLMDWILYHRDASHLVDLARQAGIRRDQISIEEEPEQINLFLHVKP